MPYADLTKRKEYIKQWKANKRLKDGKLLRGKHVRIKRTDEQLEASLQARRSYQRIWKKTYSECNPKKRMLWAARKRAKERGIECSISEDDINIPEFCPYLGLPLVSSSPRGTDRRHIMSLDRIDPTKGYTKTNVEVISHLANTMKNSASIKELINFAKAVLLKYDNTIL